MTAPILARRRKIGGSSCIKANDTPETDSQLLKIHFRILKGFKVRRISRRGEKKADS